MFCHFLKFLVVAFALMWISKIKIMSHVNKYLVWSPGFKIFEIRFVESQELEKNFIFLAIPKPVALPRLSFSLLFDFFFFNSQILRNKILIIFYILFLFLWFIFLFLIKIVMLSCILVHLQKNIGWKLNNSDYNKR